MGGPSIDRLNGDGVGGAGHHADVMRFSAGAEEVVGPPKKTVGCCVLM